MKRTGDGLLATFDGPGRGVRAALRGAAAVRPLGIDVRAGLHTGEVERRGDDVAGIGVHIGARVSALAGPGEVLVTNTVKDLVIGSELELRRPRHRNAQGRSRRLAPLGVRLTHRTMRAVQPRLRSRSRRS